MVKPYNGYYYSEWFDTFEEALKAQHIVLKKMIAEGRAIRDTTLDWETDFDSKKQKFLARVRAHIIVKEGETVPNSVYPWHIRKLPKEVNKWVQYVE